MPRRGKKTNGQMAQILSLLQKMQVGSSTTPGSKKRRRNRKKRRANPNGMSLTGGSAGDGGITISRTELAVSIQLPAKTSSTVGHVDLIPDSFAFLKSLWKSFDRVRWGKIAIFYKPAVGTTYGGLVSVGMDWDWGSDDVARVNVSAFTPNFACAAWADTEARPMVLPVSRLQSRTWYLPRTTAWQEKGPGKLHYAVDGTSDDKVHTVGELWISYTVQFSGTNPR